MGKARPCEIGVLRHQGGAHHSSQAAAESTSRPLGEEKSPPDNYLTGLSQID